MRRIAGLWFSVILIAAAGIVHLKASDSTTHTRNEFVMGTVVTMRAHGRGAERSLTEIASRLKQIHQRMTINEPGSETLEIKHQAGKSAVKVSPDTFLVIDQALEHSRATGGKFDATVEPLVSLWRIGFPDARVPSRTEVGAALSLVGYQHVQVDTAKGTVFLPKPGMGLDLGGIAKGYAADEAEAIFRRNGVKSALISVGGNVYAIGKKPDGTRWRIGIQDPLDNRGSFIAALEVEDETLVTSGGYERYLEVDGKVYHHIIDPHTGYPAETDLLSVTIVAKRSIDADALSTSLFIFGRKKALEFASVLPGTEVVLIDVNRNVYATSGVVGRLTITDENYRLVK